MSVFVGYRLATRKQITVEKLVTIGGEWQLKDNDPAIDIYKKLLEQAGEKKFPETYETYQQLNPEPDFDKLVKTIVNMWMDQTTTGYPGKRVSHIACPLLIIRGDNDHLVSLSSLVELRELVNTTVFSNLAFAGHVAFIDQTEIVLNTIKKFLNKEADNF